MVTLRNIASYQGSGTGYLALDSAGDLFGAVNPYSSGYGSIFEVVNGPTGYASTATDIATLNGTNGSQPSGPLYVDLAGNVYGSAIFGGSDFNAASSSPARSGSGTIYEAVKLPTSGYNPTATLLASDTSLGGSLDYGGLVADASGNLFGLTRDGGSTDRGVIYELRITPSGYAPPSVIASIDGFDGYSTSPLTIDSAGNLFGTNGTFIFELSKVAGGYAATTTQIVGYTSGRIFTGRLGVDAAGDLFAVTQGTPFQASSYGTILEIAKTASGYAFPAVLATFTGSNGANPIGDVTIDANGNLFGATQYGGSGYTASSQFAGRSGTGIAYEIPKTASGYGVLTTLVDFATAGLYFGGTSGLAFDTAGNLFGEAAGLVYELTGTGFAVISAVIDRNSAPNAVKDRVVNGSTVGVTASVTDVSGRAVIYSLTKSDNGAFAIDANTGVISVADHTKLNSAGAPNHSYTVSVQATDGTLTASGDFAITALPRDPTAHDLNADGTSDVLLQSGSTVVDWTLQNGQYQAGNVLANSSGFQVVGSGDFNADGTADVLLQSGSTVVDWLLQNGTYQTGNVLANSSGYQVVGTGDFNGDGTTDVLLQNGSSVVDWLLQNGQYQSGNVLANSSGYQVVGTGDFNGDGTTDVLLQNGSSVVDWLLQNGAYQSGNVLANSSGYQVVGTGDFNGDGTTDVLLQNGSSVIDWILGNGAYQSGNAIANSSGYGVVGTGDYNCDGTTDILLQSGSSVVQWTMGNGAYQSGAVLANSSGFAVKV